MKDKKKANKLGETSLLNKSSLLETEVRPLTPINLTHSVTGSKDLFQHKE